MSQYLAWGINMYQKKVKLWNRILFRMSIWILLLGIASVFIVFYFVKIQMQRNMEKQITEELQMLQENSELYVRQILLLKNNYITETGFLQYLDEIKEQLRSAGYEEIAFYDVSGQLLESSSEERFERVREQKDFSSALEGKSAFTLHYGKENACEVYFSMPIQIGNRSLGIIRYYLDYQEMYQRQWNMLNGMLRIIMVSFFLIYLVIWFMISRMISPVRKLSRISEDISRHLKDGKFNSELPDNQKFHMRRDEIGELSRNYMQMIYVTREQFEKIQEDRDYILQLLNSRQEFYNNVTHELKTPLTTISGYAQLMEKNALEDEALFYKGMEHILQESTRLHRMVVQLLEMQDNKRYLEPERIEVGEVLKSVANAMQMRAEKYENKLALEGVEKTYYIVGREDRIRQVFINLIDNAIKYGEGKETIRLQIGTKEGGVEISIINKGKGMTPEELGQIFEPFFRTDKEHSRELGSSGLGLTISKKIMEEHKGSIHAESRADGHTVFTLWFPAAAEYVKDESEEEDMG